MLKKDKIYYYAILWLSQIILGLSLVYSNDTTSNSEVSLSYVNITSESVTIAYTSEIPIYGFQFNIDGITLTNATSVFDIVSFGEGTGTVIGLNMSSMPIPAGIGDLVHLSFDPTY